MRLKRLLVQVTYEDKDKTIADDDGAPGYVLVRECGADH